MTSNRPYLLRAMYDWISDNGLTPYILVDAKQPGVHVPAHTIRDGRVVLNLAMRAVANLELGNERIRCLARFGGVSHAIDVPVDAIAAIYAHENGQGMMFSQQESGAAPSSAEAQPAAEDPPQTPDASSAQPTETDSPPPKGPPKLRVIK
ncbi:MAG TPA: ClpXP protease specificity-enhancing factor [Rhodanobacteraceae bacterium]|nr:ClpXP protease specificity-enhancing factor [Rhodanobacteraceae bacterium]